MENIRAHVEVTLRDSLKKVSKTHLITVGSLCMVIMLDESQTEELEAKMSETAARLAEAVWSNAQCRTSFLAILRIQHLR